MEGTIPTREIIFCTLQLKTMFALFLQEKKKRPDSFLFIIAIRQNNL